MDNKDQDKNKSQQGSGSAENIGRSRSDQQNKMRDLSDNEKQDIGSQIGESENRIADLRDLGQLSGRDDAAGGSGDRMENESTGKETDQ